MSSNNQSIRISSRLVFTSISIATAVIIIYSIITSGYKAFLRVDPVTIVLAVTIYLGSWLVTGLRLMIIHKAIDDKTLPVIDYFYARLLGGLMAYLTPSAIGGEPARAYYLYRKLGNSYSKYLALVTYEVFYDVMIVSIIAIGFSIYAFPLSIPVILVGLGNVTVWILLYGLFNNIVIPQRKNPIISKVLSFIEEKIISRKSMLENGYSRFGYYFRLLSKSTSLSFKIWIILLTIISNLMASLSIFVVALTYMDVEPSVLLVNSITAFYYSLTLGAIPTPGGAMAVEYGLSLALKPDVVVISRTIMYYSIIMTGFCVLLKIGLPGLSEKK